MRLLQFRLSIILNSSLETITMDLLVLVGITRPVVVDRLVKEVMMLGELEDLILRIVEDLEEVEGAGEEELCHVEVQRVHILPEEVVPDLLLPDEALVVVVVLPFLLIRKNLPPTTMSPLSGRMMINLPFQPGLFRRLLLLRILAKANLSLLILRLLHLLNLLLLLEERLHLLELNHRRPENLNLRKVFVPVRHFASFLIFPD